MNNKEIIDWLINIIDDWLVNKMEKGNQKEMGWNNALLNMKRVLIDKLSGFEEEDLK